MASNVARKMLPQAMRVAALSLAAWVLSLPGHAALFRAYLSAHGSDADPCTLPQPCRLLPAALAVVADGGEIWMLDSANFNTGPVTIAKSVTVLAVPGAVGSVVAAGGDALFATGPVELTLRNIAIAPLPGSGGVNGVRVGPGASLTMEQCVVAGMPQAGVSAEGALLRLSSTTLRDNGTHGLLLRNGASATFVGGALSGNLQAGVRIEGASASTTTVAELADVTLDHNGEGLVAVSQAATAIVQATVRDSRVAANAGAGMRAESQAGALTSLTASGNLVASNGTGLAVSGAGAKAWIVGNAVSGNGTGLSNVGASMESACDNAVRSNGANVVGALARAGESCAPNIIFVTSSLHTGSLGGLAGADATCASRALGAGLPPNAYRAWLSTTGAGAAQRIGPQARGWVGVDGRPFADRLEDIVGGRILYPLRLDESGVDVGKDLPLRTGTDAGGNSAGGTCSDWTATSGLSSFVGATGSASPLWTQASTTACANPARLVCLGTARSAPVSALSSAPTRVAFVSEGSFSAGSGLAGADAQCQAEASAASLTGTYRALLATATASAGSRFDGSGAPWSRVDGVVVHPVPAQMLASYFDAPIDTTARGAHVGNAAVWVGASTLASAGSSSATCTNWTASSGGTGVMAGAARASASGSTLPCDAGAVRLYCLQL